MSVDGSPLAIYLALPAGDDPMIIHNAAPPEASILELGSGPGRLTRVLVALGHEVVAVDDSPEMLAHVTGAERSAPTCSTSIFADASTWCWPQAISSTMPIHRNGLPYSTSANGISSPRDPSLFSDTHQAGPERTAPAPVQPARST